MSVVTVEIPPELLERDIYSARLRACDATTGFPFLSYGLMSLIPVITSKVKTCAVDKWWRVYVNPDFFSSLTPDEGAMVMVHEVWHLLLEHARRAVDYGIPTTDHEIWNCADDIEINQHDAIFKRLPGKPLTPNTFGFKRNLLAEEYYELLKKNTTTIEICFMPGSGACGSCAHGNPEDYELPEPTHSTGESKDGESKDGEAGDENSQKDYVPGISEMRAKIIAQEVARQIQEAAKSCGNVPEGWQRWADRTLTPMVDYRPFLRQSIQGMIVSKSGYVYPSYRKPSRRQHLNPDFLRPFYKDILPQVAMIIDTSGSMSDQQVGQGIAEVDGVLSTFSHRAAIAVYFTDAAAAAAQKVCCTKDLRPIGGGGTDMGEGFQAIDADVKKNPGSQPSTIIVITDGYTPWPAKPPSYANVLVVLVGDGDTAPWAKPPVHGTIKLKMPKPKPQRQH
jgi:predicted metal-dependent peptidase